MPRHGRWNGMKVPWVTRVGVERGKQMITIHTKPRKTRAVSARDGIHHKNDKAQNLRPPGYVS